MRTSLPKPFAALEWLRHVGEKLFIHAGIRWNHAGVCPEEMAELGPEVWNPEGVEGWKWQILLHCAGLRCHHMLQTLPPSESEESTHDHAHDGPEAPRG